MPATLKRGAARGAALVELVVATILITIAVSAMVSVVLQGSGHRNKFQHREQGLLQAGKLLNDLKNYVTADYSAATAASAPGGCWNFRDASGNCPAGWALSDGNHDVTFLLPSSLRDPLINGQLSYQVLTSGGRPSATVSFNWTEPQ